MGRDDPVDSDPNQTHWPSAQHACQSAPQGEMFEDRYPPVESELTACGILDRQHTRFDRSIWIGRFEQNAALIVTPLNPGPGISA